jgi:hypothetical protein
MINALIDKKDNFEIIRDRVAQILTNEVVSQKTLATAAGKDPALWNFKVYTERSNPFELIESISGGIGGDTDIINIWLESFSVNGGDTFTQQTGETRIMIDCCSAKAAVNNPAGGITTEADERASRDSERIARLVRNILMHPEYVQLGMSGTVTKRWIDRIEKMQPDTDDKPAERMIATRITLVVSHIETVDQIAPETLEAVMGLMRGSTGEVLASIDFNFVEE